MARPTPRYLPDDPKQSIEVRYDRWSREEKHLMIEVYGREHRIPWSEIYGVQEKRSRVTMLLTTAQRLGIYSSR